MNDAILKLKIQELLNQGKPEEALNFIFDAYLEEHPQAVSLDQSRDKVNFKLHTEFEEKSPENLENSKLLLYGFMSVIGHSEGDTAFNLIIFLLHLLHKGHGESIQE